MPDFQALFHQTSTKLGAKNPQILSEQFADDVEILHLGTPKAKGIGALTAHFTREWTRTEADVEVKEVKPLPGQNAVQIKSVDHSISSQVFTTTYYYVEVDGQWKVSKLDSDYDLVDA